MANVDAGDGTVGFPPCSTHARLKPISASAGQHFVDAHDVVRVGADPKVETFLASDFDEVSVAGGKAD